MTLNLVPVKTRDWEWTVGLNAAYTRNEIVSLAMVKKMILQTVGLSVNQQVLFTVMNAEVYGKKVMLQKWLSSMQTDITSRLV